MFTVEILDISFLDTQYMVCLYATILQKPLVIIIEFDTYV